MTDAPIQRRLAAILAADVVGYSRLMSQDEVETLNALKARRTTIVDPLVATHQGRIFKVTGDGVMAEFASAVNAVQCAVALQQAMARANEGSAPERAIVLRVGINLGEVMVEGDDLYGDSVNIAARLEATADPGGILISSTAYDQVHSRVAVGFEDLGEQSLKNIEARVHAYRVAGTPRAPRVPTGVPTDRPSIAVLPFNNMGGDTGQQYLSDGITEDIITELARFRHLHVLARNTSFRYRGQDVDVQRVGQELGVGYLLEGSVRRLGSRIRITAQLIDTQNGHHVWAERFDRDQEELFAVQDEVVRTIAATLVGRVAVAATERASRKPPASLAAYELVLRGDALPLYREGAAEEAKKLFEQAIAVDPGYAKAYALLASLEITASYRRLDAPDENLDRARALAEKAVALDPNDSVCQGLLARVHKACLDYIRAEYHFHKAVELNPSSAPLQAGMGDLYVTLGEPQRALEYLSAARRLDPYFDPTWFTILVGIAHFMAKNYAEAVAALRRSSEPPYWLHLYLAAAYAMLGDGDAARAEMKKTLQKQPDVTIARYLSHEQLRLASDKEHLAAAMRKAGFPE